jgi:hypothetical protein
MLSPACRALMRRTPSAVGERQMLPLYVEICKSLLNREKRIILKHPTWPNLTLFHPD